MSNFAEKGKKGLGKLLKRKNEILEHLPRMKKVWDFN